MWLNNSLLDDKLIGMSLAEIERIALELPEKDRTLLAATLLESVAPELLNHAEDEVDRRERELETGAVEEISYEELLKRVNAERAK